mgnify:CR=1 FL=1
MWKVVEAIAWKPRIRVAVQRVRALSTLETEKYCSMSDLVNPVQACSIQI